jgi:hypothetical protein
MHDPRLTIESDTAQSSWLTIGLALLGCVIGYAAWNAQITPEKQEAITAATWLSALLVVGSLASLLFLEKKILTLDPATKELQLVAKGLFGTRTLLFPFSSITGVHVSRIGNSTKGIPSYWLRFTTQDGKNISTGRWSYDQQEMLDLAEKLSSMIGCATSEAGATLNPVTGMSVLAATLSAVVIYMLWYRFSIGPWCVAMWFGTAPPVIMGVVFLVVLTLLQCVPRLRR